MEDVKQHVSVAYRLLHRYSKMLVFHWFSDVEINGEENIPEDNPYIILPCHQNGLMDCVTLLGVFKKPITFFAKSAIFVNARVIQFLTFLRIMPAYRQREGIQNVSKNEDNFLKAVDLLLLGFPLCIMPEGGQREKHHLHPFVKGPFRIAFHTQENLPEGKTIYLIPVGIDYGHYDRMGYPLVLNIAQPVNVNAYMDVHKENPAKALNIIKEDVYSLLSANMLDIRSEEYYPVIYMASYTYNFLMLDKLDLIDNQTNRLKARQAIVRYLDELAAQTPENLSALAGKCNLWLKKKPDFVSMANDYPKQKLVWVLLYLLLLLPVFTYGVILNIFVVLFVVILNPKLKNTGFSSTLKYVFFLTLSPINHLLFAILVGLATSSWVISVVTFLTGMPVTVFCGKYVRRIRIFKNKLLQNKHKEYIFDICKEMDSLFKEFVKS